MFKTEEGLLKHAVPWKEGVNVFNLERQEFPKVFRPNGALYITQRELLRKTGDLVNPDSCGYYEMSVDDSIDIDGRADLELARILLDEWKQRK